MLEMPQLRRPALAASTATVGKQRGEESFTTA